MSRCSDRLNEKGYCKHIFMQCHRVSLDKAQVLEALDSLCLPSGSNGAMCKPKVDWAIGAGHHSMKVLFLASWYPNPDNPVEGLFIRRHALAVSQYCDVSVLYIHTRGAKDKVIVSEDEGLLEIGIFRKIGSGMRHKTCDLILAYLQGIREGLEIVEARRGRPDILHVNVIYPAGLIALLLSFLKGYPYIITEHSTGYLIEDGSFSRRSILMKAAIRWAGNRAKRITTVSRKLRDAMVDAGIKNRYSIVPNVIYIASPISIRRSSIDEGGDIRKRMIHISLLDDRQKNVSGILKALKVLADRRDDFRLDIVGEGPDRRNLEALAADLSLLNDKVFFHGRASDEDIALFFSRCHFFIMNSNFETFSVVTAEALAEGKPVIVTKCGGPEEFVDESCGILLDPGDFEGLVGAIDFMLDNFQAYDPETIKKRARDRFDEKKIGMIFSGIYEEIIG